ncbi:hypothetical protein ACS0TY_010551 [Phlomoides rotata]
MLRRRTTTATVVLFHRFTITKVPHHSFFFSSTTISKPPKPFSNIPWKYRSDAIEESQQALSDYLHSTRSLPFLYADNIARNSPRRLSEIVSQIPFSPHNFYYSFRRFLRYHPINELEFLLESIGLNCDENGFPPSLLPPNTFFLSDYKHFDVVCTLAGMCFPWSKLGLLLKEECLILETDSSRLRRKISEIEGYYGFNRVCTISICLSFPRVLISNSSDLLSDLKTLFFDYDLLSSVEGNVDAMFEVCEKIKLFYSLGCGMGKVGELMGRSKSIFVDYSREALISKIVYFCKLNVEKDRVGLLLLSKPEIFSFDLENRVILVAEFLKHMGLNEKESKSLEHKYPHVFGRNNIANVPGIMKSIHLGEWFFKRMQTEDSSMLNTFPIVCTESMDEVYENNLRKIRAQRNYAYVIRKMNFLHSVGFGENRFAVKALGQLHGDSSELQQRFDYLVQCGIEYSKLCAMLVCTARMLNQKISHLEKKIEYLCTEMGLSLHFLDVFPGYLCHDLENRMKPRYRFHKWLKEQGFCDKEYALSTIIADSEKIFAARISRIDHDAARKWQEISLR